MKTLAILLLALLMIAARPASMSWFENQRTFQSVEQQGHIANPTRCPWDVDDTLSGVFTGRLERGASVSRSDCLVLDHASHLVGLKVGSGIAGSIVIAGIDGEPFAGSASGDRCLLSPQYGVPEYLALPAIGDGHGDLVTVTWTVTNVSGKPLNNAVAYTIVRLATGAALVDWGCSSGGLG